MKATGNFFTKGRFAAAVLTGAAILTMASPSARAAVTYSTSFESPAYVAGSSVIGTDGWTAGSSSGASQTVSNARGSDGTQSLFFDNTGTNNSFYSVRHGLGTFAGTILTLNVNVYVASTSNANRLSEVEFSTGTLGGGTLGLSIDGSGNVRAGTTWTALYQNAPLATFAAGTYADRWLTVTLTLDSSNGNGSVAIAGFGGATPSYSTSFTGSNVAPTFVNLGTDYAGTSLVNGATYYDQLSLATAVPEPSTVAMSLAGVGLLGVVIRRRRQVMG